MRLVLADDHILFLDALESYLKILQPDIEIEKAINFNDALRHALGEGAPDLVILDLNMPGMNGFDGLARIRKLLPEVPVVLLSGQAESLQIREGLRLGAAGFIPKDLDGEAMLKALKFVLSGGIYVPMLALREGKMPLQSRLDPSDQPDNPLSQLTRRQLGVLTLLARGMTNRGIAKELGLKEVTVAAHLGVIFRKLNVSRRTEAVAVAVRLGMKI